MNNRQLTKIFQEYLKVRILPESVCDGMRRAIFNTITIPEAMKIIEERGYQSSVAIIDNKQRVIKFTEKSE